MHREGIRNCQQLQLTAATKGQGWRGILAKCIACRGKSQGRSGGPLAHVHVSRPKWVWAKLAGAQ